MDTKGPFMSRSITPIIAILLIVFFEAIGTGLIIPILPSLVTRLVGLNASEQALIYGLTLSSSLITAFLFSQALGRASDHFGRRPLMLMTLVGTIAAYLVMSIADSIALLFVAQVIAGFCAASGGVGRAYIAEISSPNERAKNYGIISGIVGLGFILGPVIGGYLGRVDMRLPFYVAASMTSLTLLFAFFTLSESMDPEDRRPFSWSAAMPFASVSAIWKTGTLARIVLGASLVEALAISIPNERGSLVLFMQHSLSWDMTQVGLWLTLMGVAIAFGQAVMTPLVIRLFGDVNAWLVGLVGTVVVFAGAGFISAGWHMYALLVAYALVSFVAPVALGIVSRSVAPNQLGEVHGAFISASSLIKGVAVALGTWVYGYFTSPQAPMQLPGAVFFLGAALQVPAVIYALVALARNRDGKDTAAASASTKIAAG